MSTVRRTRFTILSVAVLAALSTLVLPSAAAQTPVPGTVTTVVSNLDNPRGLVIGSDGRLYVAEAGHGGSDCPAGAKGPEGQPVCFGTTGAFTRIAGGRATRLTTGLASIASPNGAGAEGLSALAQSASGQWALLMALSSHETIPGLSPADTQASNSQLGRR